MQINSQAGALPSSRQTGGTPPVPGGTFGDALVSELSPQYYSLLKAGMVFVAQSLGANPTAFTGGAAGTPLIGLYNPVASGRDLVLLQLRLGVRTTGTAAATLDFNFFASNQGSTLVTGTQSQSRNMYSMQSPGGSQAYAMANVANTGAIASNLIAPSVSLGSVGATAGLNAGLFVDDIKGAIVVAPGNYLALGASATLTAASIDASLIWAEIPA